MERRKLLRDRVGQFVVYTIICLGIIACAEAPPDVLKNNYRGPVVSDAPYDGYLVKFRTGVDTRQRSRSLSGAGLRQQGTASRLVTGLVHARTIGSKDDVIATLTTLYNDPNVVYVEPNYIILHRPPSSANRAPTPVAPAPSPTVPANTNPVNTTIAPPIRANALPNDSRFVDQWGLHNTGTTGGTADADIDAPEAWDITAGSPDIVVAVIDTGVDYNHADLAANIWTNPGEIAGNGRDDDGNGFVDDVRGWNFVADTNDPMDDNNHGTHVAGIIGAVGNNTTGISGVNWQVKIMPLRFMDNNGAGSVNGAIQALAYAIANGARVSNASWGSTTTSQALFNAIQTANNAGHVFVAAAGNSSINNDRSPEYPSSYQLNNIISVAASTMTDSMANFSNFGATSVDLAAPGMQILSTVRSNNYANFSGTSMAAPFVTGVVGLLYSLNPSLSVADVRTAILSNVDALPAFSGLVASGGRLNAQLAVASITPIPPPIETLAPEIVPSSVNIPVGGSMTMQVNNGSADMTWVIADTAIATVDVDGVVSGLAQGITELTVTDNVAGLTSSPVSVEVTTIAVNPGAPGSMLIGENFMLMASGGQPPYTWVIDDTAVASLAVSGPDQDTVNITADALGSFSLTLSDSAATANTVIFGPIDVVMPVFEVSPATSTMAVGQDLQLAATGGTSPYTYTSNDTAVVTVDAGGLVTAISGGRASIEVTDSSNPPQVSNVSLTVEATPAATLSVTPSNATIPVGVGVDLTPTGGVAPYTWTSADAAIATVVDGFVTGIAAGTVDIELSDDAGAVAIASITVMAPPGGGTPTPPARDDDDDD
ncbi:MAG: S8 family serine peptidase [Gammaproteobacteria bacterium]|nr:S8 family serine peptidase [Gammaproteobacteria bacterium]MDH5730082.1 S8 family serine peptidase [Gammaproteobacteria bacterium]